MSKYIIGIILTSMFVFGGFLPIAFAQTQTTNDIETLQDQIAILMAQIQTLQDMLVQITGQVSTANSTVGTQFSQRASVEDVTNIINILDSDPEFLFKSSNMIVWPTN